MLADRLPPPECRGVWYHCGTVNLLPDQGAVYSGPMATYCAWHRPMAVYSPEVRRSFFVYGNADNSPTLSFDDHASGTFAYPVVLGANPDGDAHRNPTLLVDEHGFLYVFYGAHGDPTRVLRSRRPLDIGEWDEAAPLDDPHTSYPQPWQLVDGELFVSFRQAPGWCFRISRDGARTWDETVNLVNFGATSEARGCVEYAIYGLTVAEAGPWPRRIHFAWSRLGGGTADEIANKHLWARRYNIYYACSDDGGRTWRRSDGSEYDLPIDERTAEKIYDCGRRGIWLKDIQVNSRGVPYLLFLDARVETFESRWMVARLTPEGWRFVHVTDSDHMYDAGALIFISDDDLRIWGPSRDVQPHEDGGDIEEWRSSDGGASWHRTRDLTTGSRFSHNHVKPVMGHQSGTGDLRAIWSYGDSRMPPQTRDVRLYYYGEAMDAPSEISFPSPPGEQR
ncbi:MAG: BNR-4 repeat-containing protein [Armatimonadetes bacterium]|nr:BNR-4 repeat-containing protein [Armatimonadota bacterium]